MVTAAQVVSQSMFNVVPPAEDLREIPAVCLRTQDAEEVQDHRDKHDCAEDPEAPAPPPP